MGKSHSLESLREVPDHPCSLSLEGKSSSQTLLRHPLDCLKPAHPSHRALLDARADLVDLLIHLLNPRNRKPHAVRDQVSDRPPQHLGEALEARRVSHSLRTEDSEELDPCSLVLSLFCSAFPFWLLIVCLRRQRCRIFHSFWGFGCSD